MSDSTDLLIREVADEIGETVEASVGLVFDLVHDVAKRIDRLGSRTVLLPITRRQQVLEAIEQTTHAVPFVAGRVAARSTAVGIRLGLTLLRAARNAANAAR
jgi:hypothetical protein